MYHQFSLSEVGTVSVSDEGAFAIDTLILALIIRTIHIFTHLHTLSMHCSKLNVNINSWIVSFFLKQVLSVPTLSAKISEIRGVRTVF